MCAGLKMPCNNVESCTTVAVGPCEGDKSSPDAYIESSFVGMAYVDDTSYLDTSDGTSVSNRMKIMNPSVPGFRDHREKLPGPSGGEYSFTMVGNIFGNTKTEGAYVGLASYLNTGTPDITANVMKVLFAETGNTPVDRSAGNVDFSDSNIGAPIGPFDVCISEVDTNDQSCGAPRKFVADEVSISI